MWIQRILTHSQNVQPSSTQINFDTGKSQKPKYFQKVGNNSIAESYKSITMQQTNIEEAMYQCRVKVKKEEEINTSCNPKGFEHNWQQLVKHNQENEMWN